MIKPAVERRAIIDTPELRKPFTKHLDNVPERVQLAWTCDKPGVSNVKYRVCLIRAADSNVVQEVTTRATEALVENLEVATDYRWTVQTVTRGGDHLSGEGRFRTDDLAPRLIRIKGVANVRDLGGRIGLGGRRTRQGLVYRSSGLNGNAHASSTNDWTPGEVKMSKGTVANVLRNLRIKTDIDLRSDRECHGMTGSPLGPTVRWIHLPSNRYAGMVTEAGKAAFKPVFRVFLDEANYPIDFHCIAGADRTGSVAYILGALLGYSDDDLMLDWSLTAMHSSKTAFNHKDRYDKLVEAFAALPGANTREKAESYVKSLGYTDDDIATFRRIMFGESTVSEVQTLEVENETEALGAVRSEELSGGRYVIEGLDWIPLRYIKMPVAGSALDFSTQPYFHRPAGKFGRVVVRNGHFEFEDLPGVPQRFYGANLCNDANFPDHQTAVELAERLARLGYNCVRLHHHDKILTGGKGPLIDPEAAERMDFLVAELIKRGIYIESNLFVSRGKLGPADLGVEDSHTPWRRQYEIKTLFTLHPPAFSNWCAFARSWLTHRNPYTGRTYAEEPCWTGMSLVNEGRYVFPYEQTKRLEPFKKAWKDWISARRANDPGCYPGVRNSTAYPDIEYADMNAGTMPLVCCDFAADMQRAFLARSRAFLVGELGFRAPLSNENNAPDNLPISQARSDAYDYVEVHAYGGGTAKGSPTRVANRNVFLPAHDLITASAWQRLIDRPFSITETSYGQPNPHRAGGYVKLGALAAFQDWGSIFHFAYAHGLNRFPEGVFGGGTRFDIQQDPIKALADRVPFLLFLRRDLEPAPEGVALVMDKASLSPANGIAARSMPSWGTNLMWRCRVGTVAEGRPAEGYQTLSHTEGWTRTGEPFALRGSPAVILDESMGRFKVQTSKTVVGVLSSGRLETEVLTCDLGAHPATVVAAALDDKPLRSSGHILFMVLGDVQRLGEVFSDASRTILLERGDNGKTVVRCMRVPVTLALQEPQSCRVYALDTAGERLGEVSAMVKDGRLAFEASTEFASGTGTVVWEIVRSGK